MMQPTQFTLPTSTPDETSVAVLTAGWSPDELRTMVSQEIELRSIIVDYYRSQMIDKKHYYTLQAGQKPALSKEGALNLCSLFKVRVAAEEPCELHHDDGHYSVRFRVHLVSMRTGEVVADGDGSCSTRESKYAYRWLKAGDVPETIDTAMLTKRSGRYGVQYRVPTSDIADHYNTVLKMSYKRAIVAAALCLPLVSELFTQDLEEYAPPMQNQPVAGQRPQREASPPKSAPVSQQVEPQQLKQLWSQINQHGVDHEAFRDYLLQRGLQSTKELTPAQLEQCLSEINSRQGQAFQLPDVTEAETPEGRQGTRAKLHEVLTTLIAEIRQAEQAQEPDEPHHPVVVGLANWLPQVGQACENPETDETELDQLLSQATDALEGLREVSLSEVAA